MRVRTAASTRALALVFGAQGLNPSMKLLLMAYADLADAHGYCPTASAARLSAMTAMSASTITRTNRALETRDLLRRQRRTRPDGSTDISLYRINLPALAALTPTETPRWNDDTMAALGYTDTPPSRPSATRETAAERPIGQSDRWRHQPISQIDRSPVDNSANTSTTGHIDRWSDLPISQSDTPKEEEVSRNPPPTPSPIDLETDGATFVAALPSAVLQRLTAVHRTRLARLIGPLLHAGHDRAALTEFLTSDLTGAQSVYAVIKRRLEIDLPLTPLHPTPATLRCSEHRGASRRADGECSACYVDRTYG
ncbi:hypothetical protein ACWEVD_01845 [Nocardia thailandica]